jgi:hypothetical protein
MSVRLRSGTNVGFFLHTGSRDGIDSGTPSLFLYYGDVI